MIHLRVVFLSFITILFSVGIFQCPQTANAETFFVSRQGDDNNPGTRALPWRTVSESTLRLSPGDRLLIQPGNYEDEGQIFVRFVDPETFEFQPLEGSESQTTRIEAATDVAPRIFGNFDIRGSYIEVSGLKILGDSTSTAPGIGVFESHHISVNNCKLAFHGGGGINFNHSDVVRATRNRCFFNGSTNPDQHSGISSFQPIVRTNTDERYGVVLNENICIGNFNEVPTSNGDVTDGNGIIIDDHYYTQFNGLIADVLAGTSDPQSSTGNPTIGIGGDGNLLPYQRRSFVSRNLCVRNGGRGVHVFLSDDVMVVNNFCRANLKSQPLLDTLPTDNNGNPFFVFGEINIGDSTRVRVVRNVAVATSTVSAAGAEQFFNLQGQVSTNRWFRNLLSNVSGGPKVSVANSDSSDLLDY